MSGQVTFNGALGGTYNRSSVPYDYVNVAAPMSLTVDFAARSANFNSSPWTDSAQTYAGTGLTGKLTYSAQQNALTGTLTTTNGALSGLVAARFFGGAAEEVGGAFYLKNATNPANTMTGAFGAGR